ncbi:UDP-2,3-diacylglucosamine diphosphatase [Acinetobacter wuhouensis]|uniref:UDP-2,3-diacylglucosamine hydrolase n=1 Tax=Acinetobacter wuhouensis TaxID=1879050 RepID=A0A4Q7AID6_9GAMM|nr:UDP-2,3-diacylglucosamine diphosphatase [Acinetobacter wuhouensis]RZG48010.1 UDP-2,3-diacylglucosamine diphosphatase [Acinetobacter wuhouensis]RZG75535.1 UDP-2,3-diacylglucosamine diphosphatase [Acinetobacter wuhouensis]
MTHLFIADLHLSPDHPRLVRGFLALLEQYQNNNAAKPTQLYILGDWFNAWIGDDYTAPWLDEIVTALKQFTSSGNQVFFLVGNRDFALGQKFLNQFNGKLLPEIYTLNIGNKKFRIEHGDALCTDDVSYQRFRKIIRNPIILGLLKSTPLSFRQKLANGFRKKSRESNQTKSYAIMDVNAQAVETALAEVDVLIHGHTHRPEIHDVNGKPRIVLGDWREKTSEAMILEVDDDGQYDFIKWTIN